MENALGNVTVFVPLKEMSKLPPQRRQIKKALGLDDEPDEPLVILQNMHIDKKNSSHDPFLVSLVINDLILHDCMLDSGASTNATPLKVMHQLEMEITSPYKNVCGFDSKPIHVYGLIKDVKVSMVANKDIFVLMDIVVIDVFDAWGMVLSRTWSPSINEQLQMNLLYAIIPEPDRTPFILYSEPRLLKHVEDLEPFPVPPSNARRTTSKETINHNPHYEISQPTQPLASQEVCQIKRSNNRSTIPRKQWILLTTGVAPEEYLKTPCPRMYQRMLVPSEIIILPEFFKSTSSYLFLLYPDSTSPTWMM